MAEITGTVNMGQGDPEETGVYAVRVHDPLLPGFMKDLFLMWMHGKWTYLRSDQRFRGPILQWVGPIPRRIKE